MTGKVGEVADPIKYFEHIAHPLHAAKTPIYAIQTILGDAVLVGVWVPFMWPTFTHYDFQIWRCYIVYNKSLYVLIPALVVLFANLGTFWTGSFVSASDYCSYRDCRLVVRLGCDSGEGYLPNGSAVHLCVLYHHDESQCMLYWYVDIVKHSVLLSYPCF